MDHYVYQNGVHVGSFATQEQAIKWAKNQAKLWLLGGSPSHPEYKVSYNPSGKVQWWLPVNQFVKYPEKKAA